jgi:hypothetical protein
MPAGRRYLRVEELDVYLNGPRNTGQRLLCRGKLVTLKIAGSVRIDRRGLDAMLKNQKGGWLGLLKN